MATPGLIEPYLYFKGTCAQALNFYREIFHGELTSLMKFSELPADEGTEEMGNIDPEAIMHANLKIGDIQLMASDDPLNQVQIGDNIVLNWSHEDPEEVKRVWQAFVDAGAEVAMPLESTFFAPLFGSLTDQFGISWQLMQWER